MGVQRRRMGRGVGAGRRRAAPSCGALVCASVAAATVEEALALMAQAKREGADVAELRLDLLDAARFDAGRDLPALLAARPLPVVVTYRPEWEGGKYTGPEAARREALALAAALGAEYIDVEMVVAKQVLDGFPASVWEGKTRVIVSHHNFQGMPTEAELRGFYSKCLDSGADIVKLAMQAHDLADVGRLLAVLEGAAADGVPMIALAMGEVGRVTRLLQGRLGGFLTFACLGDESQATAPGQCTVSEIQALYRLGGQGPGTEVFGIVGSPIGHSMSPAIHNAAFQAAGDDRVFVPVLVEGELAPALDVLGKLFKGLCVTIPHKEAALAYASAPDALSASIGAANTLVRLEGDHGFAAHNTDCLACVSAIERALVRKHGGGSEDDALRGVTVVCVGAGGAARALVYGCAAKGAKVVVANRTLAKAQALADSVGGTACSLEDLAAGRVVAEGAGAVLANSTSLGMWPKQVDETPVPAAALGGGRFAVVFDAVYNPAETRLLREAKDAGAETANGVEMFVGQACEQYKFFTGRSEAPASLMQDVVERRLGLKA